MTQGADDDRDRSGLTRSSVEGREVAFAGSLSGQQGWRRTAARVLAIGWLTLMAAGVLGVATAVLL
jgi:hypothetical protein